MVFHQHQALDFAHAALARHVHDAVHQARAQALAGKVVGHQQGKFAAGVVGVDGVARHAHDAFGVAQAAVFEHGALAVYGHQRHVAVVVDEREARQHRGRQLDDARGKAHIAALGRGFAHQALQHLCVAGVDGAHPVFAAATQRPGLLQALGVGHDGQVAVRCQRAAATAVLAHFAHHHARIHGHGAVRINDQRVDVHFAQLRQGAGHF